MLRRLTLVSVLVALLLPAAAVAHRLAAPRPSSTLEQKAAYLERVLAHDVHVLRYFRRVQPLAAPTCPAPWVQRWRSHLDSASVCLEPVRRDALLEARRLHKRQAIAASRDYRLIQRAIIERADRSWGDAVSYADRCFPGVAGWLYTVSRSEGGGGLWTWNGRGNTISEATRTRYRAIERQRGAQYLADHYRPAGAASDVGGWLQFMPGTFYAYVDDAISAARVRGCRVLSEWRSWLSPAGQALTGGYMRWSGRSGGHWSASGH